MKETLRLRAGEEARAVTVERDPSGAYIVHTTENGAGTGFAWRVLRLDGPLLELECDGRRVRAHVVRDKDGLRVHVGGRSVHVQREDGAPKRGRGKGGAEPGLEAPMPGQVRAVLVEVGAEVAEGDTLVVLEAMKMELRVRAPHAGKVAAVRCAVGEVVDRGQVLVELG